MKKTAIFCVEEVESSKQGNTRSSEQQQARKHKWVLRVFSHLTASCRQVNLIPWHWQSGQSRPSGWVVLAGSSVPHDQLHTQPYIQSLVSVSVCVWSVWVSRHVQHIGTQQPTSHHNAYKELSKLVDVCHSYTKPVTKLPSLSPANVTKSFHTHTVTDSNLLARHEQLTRYYN